MQIINNYEEPILNACMIGSITEEEEINDITFEEIKMPENKNAKIYYSDKVQTQKDSDQWKEKKEEVEKVKSYKIIVEDEIQAQENIGMEYSLKVPENLNPGRSSYIKNTLEYESLNSIETTVSNIKCTTKNQQAQIFSVANQFEENGIRTQISAISGNQCLQEGNSVKEGQGIRYKIRVTNIGNVDLSNIILEATHTNAIFYETIAYEEDANGAMVTKYKTEENENLTSKVLKIDTLAQGETKEVSYQISVKEITQENAMLTGNIKLTANNYEEKVIPNITNKIEKGNIKATLRFLYSEDVLIQEGSDVPFLAKVKNISNQELQNVIVEMPIAEGLLFIEEEFLIEEEAPYEFLGCEEQVLRFKIPKIDAQRTIDINVKLAVTQVDLEKGEEIISQYVKISNQETQYISNDVSINAKQSRVEIMVNQTTNRQQQIVKDKDEIKFFVSIENKGIIEKEISIIDQFPEGLEIKNVNLKTQDGQKQLEYDGNLLMTNEKIKPKEIMQLEIDTIVNEKLVIEEQLENYIEVEGINVYAKSNIISFTFKIEVEDDDPDIYKDDFSDEEEGPKNPSDDDGYHNVNISGTAWVDSNANGQREEQEEKIQNMTVLLIDEETGKVAKNDKGNEFIEKTKEDGTYVFDNVKQGKYVVVFQYDAKKYMVTAYQKEGVEQTVNSDVIYHKMKIQEQELEVAKTKTLEINTQDLENIDAGFIKGKAFDLKIEKNIEQITIQNKAGTKVNSYQQSKLAKVEIDAKQIQNTNVIIKYNILVTNQGEVAGYANEIVDELPKELTFIQEMNHQQWYQLEDGSLCTKELSNQMINPGETKNISLIVLKKMTKENTGTIVNKAKIGNYSNDYMKEDENTKNNESQAEVILSVRTGRILLSICFIMIVVVIIAVGVYVIKNKVLTGRGQI